MKIRLSLKNFLLYLALPLCVVAASLAGLSQSAGDATKITQITTALLERAHLSHRRLDDKLAAKFLDHYLDTLDGAHLLFLASDVAEFDQLLPQLASLTEQGDAIPAVTIFQRYRERLAQRADFVKGLLHAGAFDFTGHDTWSFDHEHALRPRDLAAAQGLWRQQLRAEFLAEKLAGKKPGEITAGLARRYDRVLGTMSKLSPDAVLELYLNALAHVYDPHSDYMGREQMESFQIAMNLKLAGVGATLEAEDGYCKIRELVPGGPAARSGLLKRGDRIVAVVRPNGETVDLVEMPLPQAVDLIRGPKGTPVRLVVIPAGAPASDRKTIDLVRDEIRLEDQRAKARVVDLPHAGGTMRVGIIDLPAFYSGSDTAGGNAPASASADVARLLAQLEADHVRAVVLDLRHNGGGSLEEATKLTGLFIRTGPVVQVRGAGGEVQVDSDNDPAIAYDGPLVVLTSRFSASASEIVAGALQDYGRAVIAGDTTTFGKGTVQNVLPLAEIFDRNGVPHSGDPGALKVTIAKFYRPDGASTQLRGVAADIVIPAPSDALGFGEAKLDDPLPWDSVPAAPHAELDRVHPRLAALRAASTLRVAGQPDFVTLREDIARMKHDLDHKTVSLNEAERRTEWDAAKKREEARKLAATVRRAAQPPSHEITLTQARPATDAAPADDASADDIIQREALDIAADYATPAKAPIFSKN